ncbi:DUF4342 domain-containing protein [Senegalia massiliensis]|uniref:DUF4342 domain-containing protein n=1 Tax=Senegalia massiliensis TaxID=1720316 RepID=UPI00103013A9|nr:DUF4342 domain-containing protein [Senegalia massiliensis]
MEISLEKIDTIRERTGVSYKEAKESLERNGGNVVDALVEIENSEKDDGFNFNQKSEEIIATLKETVKKGNVTKIILERDGETMMNIPVTAGAIGAVLAPQLSALGIAAAMISKTTIKIVKEDGEIVSLNKLAGDTMNKFMGKGKKNKTETTGE